MGFYITLPFTKSFLFYKILTIVTFLKVTVQINFVSETAAGIRSAVAATNAHKIRRKNSVKVITLTRVEGEINPTF